MILSSVEKKRPNLTPGPLYRSRFALRYASVLLVTEVVKSGKMDMVSCLGTVRVMVLDVVVMHSNDEGPWGVTLSWSSLQ